jgi:phosphatidylinositol alpha-mannosyltransferase
VVASDVDSLPEVLGDAGVLIAPDDEAALAAALGALLADPARRAALGARARERAQGYSVERMVAAWRAVYDEVAPRDRR